MIKKLQKKFILITVGVLIFVFSAVVIVMNIVNHASMLNSLSHKIDMVLDDNKKPQDHGEAPFSLRYFKVIVDGENVSVDLRRVATVDEEEALMAYQATKHDVGFYESFYYKKINQDNTTIYVFMDSSMERQSFNNFMIISISVSLGGLILISSLVIIFSKIVTKPILESYQARKEFVTNINHEIKTPIAIIKATNEVIEMEQGPSEWTQMIDKETIRMDELLKKIMFISRLDEDSFKLQKQLVCFSDIVSEITESFKLLAKSNGKEIEFSIEEKIKLYGETTMLGELVSTLLDNAIKYAKDKSRIKLNLFKQGRLIYLDVINEVDRIEVGQHNYLFERYYRKEELSSHQQGYGLGLSIAKTITSLHGGKIKAMSENNHSIKFEVIFEENK